MSVFEKWREAIAYTPRGRPIYPMVGADGAIEVERPEGTSEELTTKGKMLRVGQRFHMEVAEAVSVGGVVVVPIGTPAIGEITDVRNKGTSFQPYRNAWDPWPPPALET